MSCSLRCVPDSSPRETNVAPAAWMRRNASAGSASPAIFAGSCGGPTIRNWFHISGTRSTRWPAATLFSSAAGECAITTSASPRSASFSASPLPTAITRICRPSARPAAGTRRSSRPESCVVVVVTRFSVGPTPLLRAHAPGASASSVRISAPPIRSRMRAQYKLATRRRAPDRTGRRAALFAARAASTLAQVSCVSEDAPGALRRRSLGRSRSPSVRATACSRVFSGPCGFPPPLPPPSSPASETASSQSVDPGLM